MIKYTYSDLLNAIKKVCPLYSANMIGIDMPSRMALTIEYLWAMQVPENESTKLVRAAYSDLHRDGEFDYIRELKGENNEN